MIYDWEDQEEIDMAFFSMTADLMEEGDIFAKPPRLKRLKRYLGEAMKELSASGASNG